MIIRYKYCCGKWRRFALPDEINFGGDECIGCSTFHFYRRPGTGINKEPSPLPSAHETSIIPSSINWVHVSSREVKQMRGYQRRGSSTADDNGANFSSLRFPWGTRKKKKKKKNDWFGYTDPRGQLDDLKLPWRANRSRRARKKRSPRAGIRRSWKKKEKIRRLYEGLESLEMYGIMSNQYYQYSHLHAILLAAF